MDVILLQGNSCKPVTPCSWWNWAFHPTSAGIIQQIWLPLNTSWMKMLWEKISMLHVEIIVADLAKEFPWERDQFVIQLLFEMGYLSREILQRLNCMCIFMQVLFLSDILTASGNKINPKVILHWPTSRVRSRMRWPTECTTELDFQL